MAEKLAQFIQAHSIQAWVTAGRLFAVDEYSIDGPNGTAQFGARQIELPISLREVKNWLGY